MAEPFGYWLVKKLEAQSKLKKLGEEKEFLNSALRILNGLHIGIDEGANPYHFDIDDVEYAVVETNGTLSDVEYTEKYVKNMLSDIEKDMYNAEHDISICERAMDGEIFK